jgi:hypothetical protein
MADFRGFFNHSRALANREMVPLRGFEPLTPSLRIICNIINDKKPQKHDSFAENICKASSTFNVFHIRNKEEAPK